MVIASAEFGGKQCHDIGPYFEHAWFWIKITPYSRETFHMVWPQMHSILANRRANQHIVSYLVLTVNAVQYLLFICDSQWHCLWKCNFVIFTYCHVIDLQLFELFHLPTNTYFCNFFFNAYNVHVPVTLWCAFIIHVLWFYQRAFIIHVLWFYQCAFIIHVLWFYQRAFIIHVLWFYQRGFMIHVLWCYHRAFIIHVLW